jgi:hypothetical protein
LGSAAKAGLSTAVGFEAAEGVLPAEEAGWGAGGHRDQVAVGDVGAVEWGGEAGDLEFAEVVLRPGWGPSDPRATWTPSARASPRAAVWP